jgi:hypothetical protein
MFAHIWYLKFKQVANHMQTLMCYDSVQSARTAVQYTKDKQCVVLAATHNARCAVNRNVSRVVAGSNSSPGRRSVGVTLFTGHEGP